MNEFIKKSVFVYNESHLYQQAIDRMLAGLNLNAAGTFALTKALQDKEPSD
jgi:hypothetical protein